MTGLTFLEWMIFFIQQSRASLEHPVCLLLDGHFSHKDLAVLDYAKKHGVVLLSFSPHCTHHMQPLDKTVYGPLKTYFSEEIQKWLRNNPGRIVTDYQVSQLFGVAYCKAATVGNGQSGFLNNWALPHEP